MANNRHIQALVRFYNAMSGSDVTSPDQIPPAALDVLSGLTYGDQVRPFVLMDHRKGKSASEISRRYGLSRGAVRSILHHWHVDG